ncbi:short-chain dehydrogenase/reductase SDR [Halorhabdus utahensis DSM 12940]|uniref:Short-chain dehydrogenase/reductase SDR n=1 Tax=Halorhabdus utahensis (strain DSM 12940 / JCM 11049 / AX-2) TaxID=519442 RepID=C7NSM4_HALUD|nr:SDR family oxidoreductase [Halorhabdus utahensis]ACV13140.1 short-chain dehydrogenase/reductase SDR [Halorhabdus utahensis DSM 12940]
MTQYDFEGRVAAITGAASGIGRETAIQFAENGAAVVVADVDDAGEDVVAEIEEAGGDAVFVHTDVTSMDDVETMVETAVEEFGQLDYAVNSAGVGGDQVPTGDVEEDGFERTIDINLNGVWRSMKAELGAMTDQDDGGVIINMASVLGKVGFENSAAYVSSKHGVLGLTKTSAWEYAEEGVRVNAVCPGFIETQMLDDAGITTNEDVRDWIAGMHSEGRLGQPEEIADAVLWLCSDGASFTNGEALTVDSGFTVK